MDQEADRGTCLDNVQPGFRANDNTFQSVQRGFATALGSVLVASFSVQLQEPLVQSAAGGTSVPLAVCQPDAILSPKELLVMRRDCFSGPD